MVAPNAVGDDPSEVGNNLQIVDLDTDVPLHIQCGHRHVCVDFGANLIKCFGESDVGQLGTGTSDLIVGDAPGEMGRDLAALRVGDLSADPIVNLVAGGDATCIILSSGRAKCVGGNQDGQLVMGTTENVGLNDSTLDDSMPYAKLSTTENISKLALGQRVSCWILSNGQMKCAGSNSQGHMGYLNLSLTYGGSPNSTEDLLPYVSVGANHTVWDVCVGTHHTCVIRQSILSGNRSVVCFGLGVHGQLGIGSEANYYLNSTNVVSVDLGTDLVPSRVFCAGNQTCVLFDSGEAKCWGLQSIGQFGMGTLQTEYGNQPSTTGSHIPFVQVNGMRITDIALGLDANCFLLNTTSLACFGAASGGLLLLGENGARGFLPSHVNSDILYAKFGGCFSPGPVIETGDPPPPSEPLRQCNNSLNRVTAIHGRTTTATCVLFANHTAYCWGPANQTLIPVNESHDVQFLGTSPAFVCAHLTTAEDRCWGTLNGTLDLVGSADITVAGFSQSWGDHMCAWFSDGRAKCWGSSAYYQLGYNQTVSASALSGDGLPFLNTANRSVVFMQAGQHHTCALFSSGQMTCWGRNQYGQTGLGLGYPSGGFPIQVNHSLSFPQNEQIAEFCVMEEATCVLTVQGSRMYCWGANEYGQLGQSVKDTEVATIATQVYLGVVAGETAHLECGSVYACAILKTGRVKCWGSVLGVGGRPKTVQSIRGTATYQMGNRLEFIEVGTAQRVRQLAAFDQHVCALLEDWQVKCWGEPAYSELLGTNGTHYGTRDLVSMGDSLPYVQITNVSSIVFPCNEDNTNTDIITNTSTSSTQVLSVGLSVGVLCVWIGFMGVYVATL